MNFGTWEKGRHGGICKSSSFFLDTALTGSDGSSGRAPGPAGGLWADKLDDDFTARTRLRVLSRARFWA